MNKRKIYQKSLTVLFILCFLAGTAFLSFGNSIPRVQATTSDSTSATTFKHEIAYWWGKVNQHKVDNIWSTDPDGVSGANLDKYTYCKKWYPATQYAMYDDQENIDGWQSAGNIGNYSTETNTYHCTELDVTADYEAQKKLFKNNQNTAINVDGEQLDIKITVSSNWSDYTTCGDERIRFWVNNSYATRYMCLNESDTITIDNERIKVTLKNIIHGSSNDYAVAEVVKESAPVTNLPDLVVEDIKYYTDFSGNTVNGPNENVITADVCNRGAAVMGNSLGTTDPGYIWNWHTKFTILEKSIDVIVDGQILQVNECTDLTLGIHDDEALEDFSNITESGYYNVQVETDISALNVVAESNENNNTLTKQVYIDLEATPEATPIEININEDTSSNTNTTDQTASDDSADSSQDSLRDHIHQLRGTPQAQKLIQRLKGRILLQVESAGEAYYVAPDSDELYYLKDGPAAYSIMEDTGLGISESDFTILMSNTAAGQDLRDITKGKILLRVQARGEAYYVNPETSDVAYMADGDDAYNIMRNQSLGISNNDLGDMIELSD
ncbi:hypothetical protein KJ840_01155 [Patescibacteria group bacterium]|nr:hypothetical protein [Patescibacteria group bacterium]